jgi:glycosyltransferase involved in cell wall biosynthesis
VVVQSCDYAGPYAAGLAGGARTPLLYLEHWTAVALRELSTGQREAVRALARRANVPIAVSPNLSGALEEIGGLPTGRARMVDNPVDPSVFYAAPPVPHGGVRVVQVADFRPVKGHDLLVDALVVLGDELERMDLWFTLVGDGPERARIERRVEALGLSDRVRFAGKLSRDEIAELMRGADWTLLTSRMENAPCVVAESLSVGRPVIAPRVGGVEWMVGEGDGIVYTRSASALVAALRRAAAGDPGSWERRARAAADRWAPDAVARSWHRLLDEVGAA